MKLFRSLLLAAPMLLGITALSAQTLYNLQLNGNEARTCSGAAQVGKAGDVWNNPAWTGVPTGSTTLFSSVTLLDSSGGNNGVSATLTANYNNNKSAWNDGGVFYRYSGQKGGSATTGLMDCVVKVDYANTVNVLRLSVSGLPANRAVTVYGYGAGKESGQGAHWALGASNGGDRGMTEYDGSATGRDVTLASSEGISWASLSGTTDASGNLLITATGNKPLGSWWQVYTNGLQILVASSAELSEATRTTSAPPADKEVSVKRVSEQNKSTNVADVQNAPSTTSSQMVDNGVAPVVAAPKPEPVAEPIVEATTVTAPIETAPPAPQPSAATNSSDERDVGSAPINSVVMMILGVVLTIGIFMVAKFLFAGSNNSPAGSQRRSGPVSPPIPASVKTPPVSSSHGKGTRPASRPGSIPAPDQSDEDS